MLKRFFVVVYVLLHFPALLFLSIFNDPYIFTMMDNQIYQVRCNANNKLVVLQGTTDGTPLTFDSLNMSDPDYWGYYSEDLKFYCGYYDEILNHINAYIEAEKNGQNTVPANLAYSEFKNNVPKIYQKNYTLEVLRSDRDYSPFLYKVFDFVLAVLMYYLVLQIVRMVYQYIVYGKFNWHPYKRIRT